jgi:hypothetical protein
MTLSNATLNEFWMDLESISTDLLEIKHNVDRMTEGERRQLINYQVPIPNIENMTPVIGILETIGVILLSMIEELNK